MAARLECTPLRVDGGQKRFVGGPVLPSPTLRHGGHFAITLRVVPVPLALDTVLRRQPGADEQTLNGEMVVLDAEGTMVRALNGTGARVWQLMDGRRTVRDICTAIAEEFDAGPEAVRADVIAFIEDLCRVRLAVGAV